MSDDLIFQYPAKVLKVGKRARDGLLELAKSSGAYDAEIFEERAPFFWSAEISNNQIDAYYTHMMDSTLANFAEDSRMGVGFLNSHRHNELPFGRSLDARVEEDGTRKRVLTDFFTLPGLNLNGITTDDFIAGVRSGIVSDVSVGFHGGKWFCDVCGGNYRDYHACQHMAGMDIETKDGYVTVTVGIDGARLSEVSAVYDGATPDATILKAQRMAEAGELDPKMRTTLEARYRMRLPETRSFAGVDMPQRNDTNAQIQGETMDFEKVVNDVRGALGIGKDADVISAVTAIAEQAQKLRSVEEDRNAVATKLEAEQTRANELSAKVAELEPQAADGRAYRTDLIADAIAEGVRARGEDFDVETYRGVLESAPIAVIKRMKADWQAVGDSQFVGGRKTTDEGEQAPGKKSERKPVISQSAYKV